ncbi:MAG: hypothetical protein E6I65_10510 [Chloroflexi bacterium]|nr:MAG: hypothetical protein E6I65_10510 [Chloroflexota bacterium]
MPSRLRAGLAFGVVGGVGWFAADILRASAFSRDYGGAEYVLTNRLVGAAGLLVLLGAVASVITIGGRLGRPGRLFGWIAVAGLAMLAAGSLAEFVFFIDDPSNLGPDGLAAQGWYTFVYGLLVTPVGLTGLGLQLWRSAAGAERLVAGWLVASFPLMIAAGFVLGLLGTTLAVGVSGLCLLLLSERRNAAQVRSSSP